MFYLKELRRESGIKRSELARLTGIHQNTLANYENGTREAPYDVLILLADFFDTSVDELLGHKIENTRMGNAEILSANERKFAIRYRELDLRNKERAEDYMNLLEQSQNNPIFRD